MEWIFLDQVPRFRLEACLGGQEVGWNCSCMPTNQPYTTVSFSRAAASHNRIRAAEKTPDSTVASPGPPPPATSGLRGGPLRHNNERPHRATGADSRWSDTKLETDAPAGIPGETSPRAPHCTAAPGLRDAATHADPHPIRIGPAPHRAGALSPARPEPDRRRTPRAVACGRSGGIEATPLKNIPFFASRTASRLRSSPPAPVTPSSLRAAAASTSSVPPSHSLDSRSQTVAHGHGASAANRCPLFLFDCVPLYSHALQQVGEAYNS